MSKVEKPEIAPYRDRPEDLFALRARFHQAVEATRKEIARLSNIPTVLLLASMALGEYNWGNVDNERKALFHLWSLATIIYFQKLRRDRESHLRSVLRYEGNLALQADDTSAQKDFQKDTALSRSEFNQFIHSIQPIEAPTLLVLAPVVMQLMAQAKHVEIEAVKWWWVFIGMVLAQLATRTQYEELADEFKEKMYGFAKNITPPQAATTSVRIASEGQSDSGKADADDNSGTVATRRATR